MALGSTQWTDLSRFRFNHIQNKPSKAWSGPAAKQLLYCWIATYPTADFCGFSPLDKREQLLVEVQRRLWVRILHCIIRFAYNCTGCTQCWIRLVTNYTRLNIVVAFNARFQMYSFLHALHITDRILIYNHQYRGVPTLLKFAEIQPSKCGRWHHNWLSNLITCTVLIFTP